MNYQKIYKQLTATDMIAEYTEEHHIIPDFFFINRKRKGPKGWLVGNPDDPTNLVRLTPEAHYTAHQLLVKIYPEHVGLVFAAHRMTSGERRNNKLYGWLRRKHATAMKNKIVSEETRAKIGAANKGKIVSDETRAKIGASKKGKSPSAETRAKLSVANKGKSPSAETRAKLSVASKGTFRTSEVRSKMSAAMKGKVRIKLLCPHCGKEIAAGNFTRWHGENCKRKV